MGRTTHVSGSDLGLVYNVEGGFCDAVGSVVETRRWLVTLFLSLGMRTVPKMSQHHSGAQDHGRRVGSVSAHEVFSNMSATGFEQRVFLHLSGSMK